MFASASRRAVSPGCSTSSNQPQEIVMSRTSSFLTVALSVTAIGSATIPAAAFPLKVFGGGSNHLSQLPSAAPALTNVRASQEASHILGPQKVVNLPPKIPTAGSSKVSLGKAEQ